MFNLIGTILIGFIAGLIARAIYPGEQKLGFWLTAGLGLAGAFVAKLLAKLIGLSPNIGLIGSVIGALVVLAIYSFVQKKRLLQ